jgi:single-stranded DNA-binding protein
MNLHGLIRLVKKPQLEKTDNDISVCTFTGVYNERRKTPDKVVDDAHYLDFTIWDKAADFVCDKFDKGDLIYIESATPRQRKWVDAEGKKHSRIIFRVNSFQRVSRPQRVENESQE